MLNNFRERRLALLMGVTALLSQFPARAAGNAEPPPPNDPHGPPGRPPRPPIKKSASSSVKRPRSPRKAMTERVQAKPPPPPDEKK
jgi:hypothetical protein